MHKLAGQPWLPKGVKINEARIQSPSPQQHPHRIPSVTFCSGSCKLDLVFYRLLVKSFLQIPSSPNPLLSSAAAEVAEENLSFFFFSDSFFLFFSRSVNWKEIDGRLMAGEFEGFHWAAGIEELYVFFLCRVDDNINSCEEKQSLDVSAIHSPLLLFAVTASTGASYGGKVAMTAQQGEGQPLWPEPSKGTIFYHISVIAILFSEQPLRGGRSAVPYP